MTTYFGQCNSDGTTKGSTGNSDATWTWWAAYTCPGSGSQSVTAAGIYGRIAGGGTNLVRMAIYNSAGTTLIGESGTAALPTTPEAWVSVTFTGITLTGGTSYKLACTTNAGGITTAVGGPDTISWYSGTYTGGFPASLPSPGGTATNQYNYRVGVDAAASGGGIPIFRARRKIVPMRRGLAGGRDDLAADEMRLWEQVRRAA